MLFAYRHVYSGNMPQGKHAGIRTMITLPPEIDRVYAEFARIVRTRKATIMAHWLVELMPMLREVVEAEKAGKLQEDYLKQRLGAALLDILTRDG